jgi:hypothetical protein
MMFSGFPRSMRIMIRASLAGAWSLVCLSALVDLVFGGTSPLHYIASAVVASATALAAMGVVANRYRWEWVSAWFAAAGLTPYILSSWVQTVTVHPHYATSALLLTALGGFFVVRALMCAAHAAKLRSVYEQEVGGGE